MSKGSEGFVTIRYRVFFNPTDNGRNGGQAIVFFVVKVLLHTADWLTRVKTTIGLQVYSVKAQRPVASCMIRRPMGTGL
jgi:hypothetical protein